MRKCILLFAQNRPESLARVIHALSLCEDLASWDIHQTQDGPRPSDTLALSRQTQEVALRLQSFPCKVTMTTYPANVGVGVAQHDAIRRAFLDHAYDRILHLEDDLVLSKTYLQSIDALLTLTESDATVATVMGGQKNTPESASYGGASEPLQVVPTPTVHAWGFGMSRTKFLRVAALQKRSVDLMYREKDYRTRRGEVINRQRASLGLDSMETSSHDATLQLCLRKAGMPYVVLPCRRHSLPIGRVGLHSTSELFTQKGLDDTTLDQEHDAIHL